MVHVSGNLCRCSVIVFCVPTKFLACCQPTVLCQPIAVDVVEKKTYLTASIKMVITLYSVCYASSRIYMYMCIYMSQNIARLVSSWSKNLWESIHGTFLSHLDIMNVMVDCWFTSGWALLLFHTCVLPWDCRGAGVHTCAHWLVGVLLLIAQCWR